MTHVNQVRSTNTIADHWASGYYEIAFGTLVTDIKVNSYASYCVFVAGNNNLIYICIYNRVMHHIFCCCRLLSSYWVFQHTLSLTLFRAHTVTFLTNGKKQNTQSHGPYINGIPINHITKTNPQQNTHSQTQTHAKNPISSSGILAGFAHFLSSHSLLVNILYTPRRISELSSYMQFNPCQDKDTFCNQTWCSTLLGPLL